MSNLRLINETTTDTGVEQINITDVFSADFDIYQIAVTDFERSSSNDVWFYLRYINSAGSVVTASNYDYAFLQMRSDSSFSEFRGTNQSYSIYTISASSSGGAMSMFIFNPYSSSSYTFMLNQHSLLDTTPNANMNGKQINVLKQTSSITGFQLYSSVAGRGVDNAKIKVYGLRVDS